MSANRINVCDVIKCPFANVNPKPPRSSGCIRYSVSNHCHLLEDALGHREKLQPNQYWLNAPSDVDVEAIKKDNDWIIASDESAQRRLAMESELS